MSDSLLSDLRLVARGWRWSRRALLVGADRPPRRPPATTWARTPLARLVREAGQACLLGPLLHGALDVTVGGREQLGRLRPPVVFVANHASHLDTLLVLHALPAAWRQRTVVAAAADYFFDTWWRAAAVALACNAVPVDRRARAGAPAEQHELASVTGGLHELAALLGAGWSVLSFPEGTRSRDGTLQRLHHGPAHLAILLQRPLVPVAVRGTFSTLPVGARWPRRNGSPAPVAVRFGTPLGPRPGERAPALTARIRLALEQTLAEDATSWWAALPRPTASPASPAPAAPPARWRRVWAATTPLPPSDQRPTIWR